MGVCVAPTEDGACFAVYAEEGLPSDWQEYAQINSPNFGGPQAARQRVDGVKPLVPQEAW